MKSKAICIPFFLLLCGVVHATNGRNFQLMNKISSYAKLYARDKKIKGYQKLDLWVSVNVLAGRWLSFFKKIGDTQDIGSFQYKKDQLFKLNPGAVVEAVIEPYKQVNIEIKFYHGKSKDNLIGQYTISKKEGKTVYLTLGRRRGKGPVTLYPQTGPLRGLKGKTVHRGYSLKDNITSVLAGTPRADTSIKLFNVVPDTGPLK